jgi:hypothetical protein
MLSTSAGTIGRTSKAITAFMFAHENCRLQGAEDADELKVFPEC